MWKLTVLLGSALLILLSACGKTKPAEAPAPSPAPIAKPSEIPTPAPLPPAIPVIPPPLAPAPEPKPAAPVPPPPPPPEFKATVNKTVVANVYLVRLDWRNLPSNPEVWIVERSDGRTVLSPLTTISGQGHVFIDTNLVPGTTYTYSIKADDREGSQPLATAKVDIPRDLEVRGVMQINSIRKIHRLFLSPGSTLRTEGGKLEIEVDELHADGGVIETFAANSVALDGSDGRAGGEMILKAKTATGDLHLFSRGETGGHGRNGRDGVNGARGKDGEGCAVCRGLAESRFDAWTVSTCKFQNSYGYMGTVGGDGTAGMSGANGGDSARVLIAVDAPAKFRVVPHSEVGKGGAGGVGGKPGVGGLGGKPYPENFPAACKMGEDGPKSADGRAGSNGIAGLDGKPQPTCLRLGGATFGDCETF